MKVVLLLSAAVSLLQLSTSALTSTTRTLSQHRKLQEYVNNLSSKTIDLSLNVQENGSHLCVSGMSLTFQNEMVDTVSHTLKMPGIDGPLPQLSSGLFSLQLVNPGSYVDMKGRQSVFLENSIWEMCWSDGAPSGSVVFGFTVPQDYTRNDASLWSSLTYFCTLPVFSRDGLCELQHDKMRMMEEVDRLEKIRKYAVSKADATFNPLIKAAEYSKAMDATERLSYYDLQRLELIPSDKEVFSISPSLLLANTGQIWSRCSSGKRLVHGKAFVSRSGGPVLAP